MKIILRLIVCYLILFLIFEKNGCKRSEWIDYTQHKIEENRKVELEHEVKNQIGIA